MIVVSCWYISSTTGVFDLTSTPFPQPPQPDIHRMDEMTIEFQIELQNVCLYFFIVPMQLQPKEICAYQDGSIILILKTIVVRGPVLIKSLRWNFQRIVWFHRNIVSGMDVWSSVWLYMQRRPLYSVLGSSISKNYLKYVCTTMHIYTCQKLLSRYIYFIVM